MLFIDSIIPFNQGTPIRYFSSDHKISLIAPYVNVIESLGFLILGAALIDGNSRGFVSSKRGVSDELTKISDLYELRERGGRIVKFSRE